MSDQAGGIGMDIPAYTHLPSAICLPFRVSLATTYGAASIPIYIHNLKFYAACGFYLRKLSI